MKKLLIASTALVALTGAAVADVSVGGDGRMGITYDSAAANSTAFSSRIRISFAASGETDGGLAFGGSVRADNSVGGAAGTAGSVFISGGFGKLSMGDVDGAAKASVGHVAGIGYTGIGDLNESTYIANAGDDPSALYEYSADTLGLKVSASNPGDGSVEWALGVTYAINDITLALGYEDNGAGTDHVIAGASATIGGISLKGIYGKASGVTSGDQFAVSAGYTSGPLGATVFYTDDEELGGVKAVGVGASYDLGGGAAIKGGVARNQTADSTVADFGITMSF